MSNIYDTALRYAEAGLSVIPIKADGSKKPAWWLLPKAGDGKPTWKPYQKEIAGPDELRRMFSSEVGIGISCGRVSGNLEDLDFDDVAFYRRWYELIKQQGSAELLDKLVIIQTPGPGMAVPYRCEQEVDHNQQLAMKPVVGKLEVAIETRGEGGYFLAPGCPAKCHPTGKPYHFIHGNFSSIPTLTTAERAILIKAARSLDESAKQTRLPAPTLAPGGNGGRQNTPRVAHPSTYPDDDPGGDFYRRATWKEILEPHGWKLDHDSEGEGYWRRPGKDSDYSATTNHNNSDLLHVFSSSAHPFEVEHDYSKFAALALLEYNGDQIATAQALAKRGFGCPTLETKADPQTDSNPFAPPSHWSWLDTADARKWKCEPLRWVVEDIFARGTVGYVAADSQAGKSLLMIYTALMIARGERLFDTFNVTEAERVLYLALEDPPRRLRRRLLDTDRTGNLCGPRKLQFLVAPGLRLNDVLCFKWLEETIEDGKYEVVVIDTFQKGTPGLVSFEDKEITPILHGLQDLARRLDILIVIIDHLAKPKDGRRRKQLLITDIKGTGGKAQNADTVILLNRANPDELTVQVMCKDSDKRLHFLLRISPEGVTDKAKFEYVCDLSQASSQAKEKIAERQLGIRQAMAGRGWMSKAEIAAVAPSNTETTLGRDLKELCSQNAIESNNKQGRWRRYRSILPLIDAEVLSDTVSAINADTSIAHSESPLFNTGLNSSPPRTDRRES